MPILAAGSSVTLTLGAYDSVTIDAPGGSGATVESPVGTRIAALGAGHRTFGPYGAGTQVKITSEGAGVLYEVQDGSENPALTPSLVAALQDIGAISQAFVRWCIPGKDTSGTLFKDVSGRGNDATIDASNGTPFAVDNRISTVAHLSAGGVTQTLAATLCDFASDSIIMSVAFMRADPAGSEAIMAFGEGSGAGFPGFYFSHRSSAAGVGRMIANIGNGTLVSGSDTTVKFSNAGGTRETHALMAYDAPTRSMYLYRDGVLAAANAGALTGGSAWTATVPALGARIGGIGGGQTYAATWRGWQAYVFTGKGLPLNIGRIAALLAESPAVPLMNHEFAFA